MTFPHALVLGVASGATGAAVALTVACHKRRPRSGNKFDRWRQGGAPRL
jgi:hypothetical protein